NIKDKVPKSGNPPARLSRTGGFIGGTALMNSTLPGKSLDRGLLNLSRRFVSCFRHGPPRPLDTPTRHRPPPLGRARAARLLIRLEPKKHKRVQEENEGRDRKGSPDVIRAAHSATRPANAPQGIPPEQEGQDGA